MKKYNDIINESIKESEDLAEEFFKLIEKDLSSIKEYNPQNEEFDVHTSQGSNTIHGKTTYFIHSAEVLYGFEIYSFHFNNIKIFMDNIEKALSKYTHFIELALAPMDMTKEYVYLSVRINNFQDKIKTEKIFKTLNPINKFKL